MQNTVKRARVLYALIIAFFIGLGILLYSFIANGDVWATNRANNHLYKNRQLATAGTIYDINGDILAQTVDGERVYNPDERTRKAVLHVVGDTEGFIATGIQSVYRSDLLGYSFVDGIYDTINSGRGNDITLTIDAGVSAAARKALDGRKGTVGVYNYKTGAVMCMVSSPSFDPGNKPSDLTSDEYDGVYINRFISGVFTPGSTFKVVTAICALENIPDIYDRSFNCKGYCVIDGSKVICNSTHGKVSFKQALNRSCNSAFALIARELGAEKLTATVRALGLGKNIQIGKISAYRSTFDLSGTSPIDVGWAGIGQYTTLVNPCQMLVLMGAIANGGTAMSPYLIDSFPSKSELFTGGGGQAYEGVSLSADIANQMKSLLRASVTDVYYDRFRSALEMCGKTGTAEVAGKRPHAWFVGFSQREDLPYAIVVMVENGGGGSSQAIPIANKVMKVIAGYND